MMCICLLPRTLFQQLYNRIFSGARQTVCMKYGKNLEVFLWTINLTSHPEFLKSGYILIILENCTLHPCYLIFLNKLFLEGEVERSVILTELTQDIA